MADNFWEIHEERKGIWTFFLDCASWMLIGWAGKLWSRGVVTRITLGKVENVGPSRKKLKKGHVIALAKGFASVAAMGHLV